MTRFAALSLTQARLLKECVAFSASLLLATAAIAQSRPPSAEAALLKFEDQLFSADVHRDASAVQQGFAEEAVFVHANGAIQTKAEYLQSMEKFNFQSIEGVDRVVKIVGSVGVIRGTKNLVLGNGMHLSGTYLTVYLMRDGHWQMLDEQSAPAPKAAENK